MKVRRLIRYYAGGSGSGRAGDRERRVHSSETLQVWDEKNNEWVDVPTVEDNESYRAAYKEVNGHEPRR